MNDKLNPFHLAIPVSDLEESVAFYKGILELEPGRSSDKWADFNFFGHQLVCHISNNINEQTINVSLSLSGSRDEQESYRVFAYPPDLKFLYLKPSLLRTLSTCSKCNSSSLARGERNFAKIKCGYL